MHVLGPDRNVAGYLLCPQYGIAIKTYPGDTVVFNARDGIHANSDLEGVFMDPADYWKYRETWEQAAPHLGRLL
jgi:hypothetical protein